MGSPSRSSAINANVTIDVYRNLFNPFFTGEPFTTSITENTVTSTSILQVNFDDRDTDVSNYFARLWWYIYVVGFSACQKTHP